MKSNELTTKGEKREVIRRHRRATSRSVEPPLKRDDNMRYILQSTLLFALLLLTAPAHAQCPDRLLMSAYYSGNVHIYDPCTGQFQGNLGSGTELAGAQASRIGPDGLLYVVAEERDRIVRFDPQTLAAVGGDIVLPPNFGATGIVFRNNEIWVASYTLSLVRRFDLANGNALGDAVGANAGGLRGADNGMVFGPDGMLYIPGFDSDNVVRLDPASGATSTFIATRSGTLRNTRGIVFEPGGQTLLVSSEGNGRILRYSASSGGFVGELAGGLSRPTGMTLDRDGTLLVAVATGVIRIDPANGANLGNVALATQGNANGPTFVTLLPAAEATGPIDQEQVGSQFWLSAGGSIDNNELELDAVMASFGSRFGNDHDPGQIQRKRWGSARIRFTSCTTGEFSWNSSGPDSAGFGQGGYPIQRLMDSPASQRCQQVGFQNAPDREWISGSWWGGPLRDGEGLLIDVNSDDFAFVAWFTYRPQ